MILLRRFYFSLVAVLLFSALANAQSCNSCTFAVSGYDSLTQVYHVSNTDTSAYTLSTGQTLCIYNTGTFKGTVTNNGGTICNRGRFIPKTLSFSSGTILNYKTFMLKQNLTLGSAAILINAGGSVLNSAGTLSLSGGTLSNEGLINISGTFQNNSGSCSNKAIINCSSLSGSNPISNYQIGIVNIKN